MEWKWSAGKKYIKKNQILYRKGLTTMEKKIQFLAVLNTSVGTSIFQEQMMYYYSQLLGSTTLYQVHNFSVAQEKCQIPKFFHMSYHCFIVIPQMFPPQAKTYNCIHIILPTGPIQPVRAKGLLVTDVS